MDLNKWLDMFCSALQKQFGPRIVYSALGGSRARGEATDTSDIDINTVLDNVTVDDLLAYRQVLAAMPHGDRACGFIAGAAQIKAWPAHELFQFVCGAKTLIGSLEGMVAFPSDDDIRLHIRITAGAIYHEAGHRLIYGAHAAEEAKALKDAYKAAFFVLQEMVFLKTRRYIPTRRDLAAELEGNDRAVLETAINWDTALDEHAHNPLRFFSELMAWSAAVLTAFSHT